MYWHVFHFTDIMKRTFYIPPSDNIGNIRSDLEGCLLLKTEAVLCVLVVGNGINDTSFGLYLSVGGAMGSLWMVTKQEGKRRGEG